MTPDEARALIQRSLGPPRDGPELDLSEAWGVLAADGLWRIVSNSPPVYWRELLEAVTSAVAQRGGGRFIRDLAVATGGNCDGCGAWSPVPDPSTIYVCPECRADQAEHARPPF